MLTFVILLFVNAHKGRGMQDGIGRCFLLNSCAKRRKKIILFMTQTTSLNSSCVYNSALRKCTVRKSSSTIWRIIAVFCFVKGIKFVEFQCAELKNSFYSIMQKGKIRCIPVCKTRQKESLYFIVKRKRNHCIPFMTPSTSPNSILVFVVLPFLNTH